MKFQTQGAVSLTVDVKGSMGQICKIPISTDLSYLRIVMSLDLQGHQIMARAVCL